jgi:hypothetical protein
VPSITDIFTSMTQIEPSAAHEAYERFRQLLESLPDEILSKVPPQTQRTKPFMVNNFYVAQRKSSRSKSEEELDAEMMKLLSAHARRMRRADRLQREAKKENHLSGIRA